MSYLAIQLIQIAYTDDQRGRVDAERRKRFRALPLEVKAGDGVLHDCRVNARYELTTTAGSVPVHEGAVHIAGLRLRTDDDVLTIEIDEHTAITLREGTWGRVLLNAKHHTFDTKWLSEIVVNAGLFAGPPASQVFRGTPALERDLRRDFLRAGYSS